eukprot:Opistho-2@90692
MTASSTPMPAPPAWCSIFLALDRCSLGRQPGDAGPVAGIDRILRRQPGAAADLDIGQAQELWRRLQRDAARGAEGHIGEGPGQGLQQVDAAHGHGREQLQEGEAGGIGLHHLAGRRHAGQQGQALRLAGTADGIGIAGADAELAAGILGRHHIGHRAQGAGADDGLGHGARHRFHGLQGHGRAQSHFQHTHPTSHQGLGQRHGVFQALDHDDGNDGAMAGQAQGVFDAHRFVLSIQSHETAPSSAVRTLRRMPAKSSRPRPWPFSAACSGVMVASSRAAHSSAGTRASSSPLTASRRTRSPSRKRPSGPPARASGLTWMAAGILPEAPLMRPSVTRATLKPLPCSTDSGGVSLCSSGMPLACGPWKRTTTITSRSSSPAFPCTLR